MKTKMVCKYCGHEWQTVKPSRAYCPKCGVWNVVVKATKTNNPRSAGVFYLAEEQ